MKNPWTIPFNNINYVCWRDDKDQPHYRQMTEQEEREYFTAPDRERYLSELLRK